MCPPQVNPTCLPRVCGLFRPPFLSPPPLTLTLLSLVLERKLTLLHPNSPAVRARTSAPTSLQSSLARQRTGKPGALLPKAIASLLPHSGWARGMVNQLIPIPRSPAQGYPVTVHKADPNKKSSIPASSLGYVTLGKWLTLSGPQFCICNPRYRDLSTLAERQCAEPEPAAWGGWQWELRVLTCTETGRGEQQAEQQRP